MQAIIIVAAFMLVGATLRQVSIPAIILFILIRLADYVILSFTAETVIIGALFIATSMRASWRERRAAQRVWEDYSEEAEDYAQHRLDELRARR